MLPSKVERMMFIRLNRHLVAEVRELDAAVEQSKATTKAATGDSRSLGLHGAEEATTLYCSSFLFFFFVCFFVFFLIFWLFLFSSRVPEYALSSWHVPGF
ncbi:unnamed protein product [Pylaiella littoralis]